MIHESLGVTSEIAYYELPSTATVARWIKKWWVQISAETMDAALGREWEKKCGLNRRPVVFQEAAFLLLCLRAGRWSKG